MPPQFATPESNGTLTILRLNRPPANAITLEAAQEFEAALDETMAREPSAIVLTGTGAFFSGGLDLKAVPIYTPEQQRALLQTVNRLFGKLYACPIPMVGAINGHAVGGAFMLILATDYRVGPEGKGYFGLTEARVGIPFPAAPRIVLGAELAPEHVRFTTLHARNFGPVEAQRRGVFDELQSPEAVLDRAIEVARDLASMPPDSYRRVKLQMRGDTIARIEEMNARGTDPMLAGWVSPDAAQASATVLQGG